MYEGGYCGKILYVDLSSGKIETKPLETDLIRDFIGGSGINTKIAYDLMGPEVKPLSEESVVVFGGGVFQGTAIIGAAKVSATFVLPTNNQISTGVGGGTLGFMLKLAGYDHVVIRGRAERPSYLKIFDDEVKICDAGEIWGKDLYTATDMLWEKHGGTCSVFAIGTGGERLIPFSLGLLDKAGNLGKGGLGAEMGSKNLKALVVRGTKGVKVANRRKLNSLINDLYARGNAFKGRDAWVELGLLSYWDSMVKDQGGMPGCNARVMMPAKELDAKFGIETYKKELQSKGLACPSCTLNDKFTVWPADNPQKRTFVSSFLGVVVSAAALGFENYSEALEYHDILNRFGLDKHTTNCLLDYALELFERGIITESDTGGVPLGHNLGSCKLLLQQMMEGEGAGGILAGGWPAAIEHFGKDTESFAIQIKGLSPALDPRLGFGTDKVAMLVSPRAQAARGGSPTLGRGSTPFWLLEKWARKIGMPEAAINHALDKDSGEGNMSRLLRYAEDWIGLFDCVGLCGRPATNRLYYADTVAELYTALTGIEITIRELLTCAERFLNLERQIQAERGFTRKEEKLPKRILDEPLSTADGKTIFLNDFYHHGRVTEDELNKILDDYYDVRGWDSKGTPTAEKLKELGLDNPV